MLRGRLSVIMAIRPLRGAGSGVLGMSCGIPHTPIPTAHGSPGFGRTPCRWGGCQAVVRGGEWCICYDEWGAVAAPRHFSTPLKSCSSSWVRASFAGSPRHSASLPQLVADTCLAELTGSAACRSYFPIEDLAAICVEEEEAGYDRGRQ